MSDLLTISDWAALVLPLWVFVGLVLFARRRRHVARALGDLALLRRVMNIELLRTPWARIVLVAAAAVALGVALADPHWGTEVGAAGRGGPVILVLDVSNSMTATDVNPNRLEAGRAALGRLVGEMPGTPVGIVVFAGRAYALTPPTVDPGAIALYLDALDPQMVTQTGSSLSAAIRQGIALLASANSEDGALVLVSDGEALESEELVQAAIDAARNAGVPVYAVGVGTAAGAQVPDIDFATGQRIGYKRAANGQLIISRLNEDLLRQIALETGGEYLPLVNSRTVQRLAADLRNRPGGAATATSSSDAPPQYAWFAAAALLLLALEAGAARLYPRAST